MAEKVTTMVLKVDLQCSKCYKKVKKILCQFPQIRDQKFDEKSNTVTITVVCCSPEKIRDKLCRKGGGTIKSIDIKDKPPPTPTPKIDPPPTPTPKIDPPPTPTPKIDPAPRPKWYPPQGYPQYPAYYCLPYYDGPCHQPPPCHCGCGGRSGRDAYGRGYCWNRCDYYIIEENTSACSVM